MGHVTLSLDQAMRNMNLEQVAKIMDKFESQFENLDVHATVSYLFFCHNGALTLNARNLLHVAASFFSYLLRYGLDCVLNEKSIDSTL